VAAAVGDVLAITLEFSVTGLPGKDAAAHTWSPELSAGVVSPVMRVSLMIITPW
jgi:hypothetical protein